MALVLDTAEYDEVRRAVNPTLDIAALPDALIASDVYSGRAARYVDRMVTNAEARIGEEAVSVQRAVRYKTAAYLAEMLPEVKQSQLPDQEVTFDTFSRKERAAILNRMADEEIVALNATRVEITRPTFFTLAAGRYR